MAMTQDLEVTLEGRAPFTITIDQRDVAAVELQEWYVSGPAPLTTLRHLAYTACRRQGHIPADTTWPDFAERIAVAVDAIGDDEPDGEDEQREDPTPASSPGPTTSSGAGS